MAGFENGKYIIQEDDICSVKRTEICNQYVQFLTVNDISKSLLFGCFHHVLFARKVTVALMYELQAKI
jgi:hypothetical protein